MPLTHNIEFGLEDSFLFTLERFCNINASIDARMTLSPNQSWRVIAGGFGWLKFNPLSPCYHRSHIWPKMHCWGFAPTSVIRKCFFRERK